MDSPSPRDDAPPLTIGRYALCRELASGGMATVHLARIAGAAGFSRAVAVKRLHPQYARNPEFVAMFTDEARLASRIRHPNVVPTIDVVQHKRELFLVMEFVHGLTLSKLAKADDGTRRALAPPLAVSIIIGVLRGLHAAHEAESDQGESLRIVHRDVSPQNIMIDKDGAARLLDFGVAKAASRIHTTEEGRIKGKLAYMSPEQLEGLPVDRRTDVYAASIVLWELLTGERLYSSAQGDASVSRILAADVPPPSSKNPSIAAELDPI